MVNTPTWGTDIQFEFPPELVTYKNGEQQLILSLRTPHVNSGEDTISVNNAMAVRMGHAGFRQERSGAGKNIRGSTAFVTENKQTIKHFLQIFSDEGVAVNEKQRDEKPHLELPESVRDFMQYLAQDAGSYLKRVRRRHPVDGNGNGKDNGHGGRGRAG